MTAAMTLADAIRKVTASVQQAIDDGHRSRAIDADDLVEVLLCIADELDPERAVERPLACPECGSTKSTDVDNDVVACTGCGVEYLIR
jgi:DNA-directed RNA polymerase subunit RPC12/RpoP